MTDDSLNGAVLVSEPLCIADFRVEGGIFSAGRSPFGEQRVGYVSGGSFEGPRLKGEILPGGGNWPRSGVLADGAAAGTFDARAVWRTDDGATIYVTYTGRSRVPADVAAAFRDPAAPPVDPSRYYLRIAPVFETGDARYEWLNTVLAVGVGERMPWGVRHRVFAIL
jgi:hypothetical protein